MKNWKVLFFAIGFITLLAWQTHENKQQEKKYTVSFTQEEWTMRLSYLDVALKIMEKSTYPANVANGWKDSVIKFQQEIVQQVNQQLISQNGKTDSSGVKKNVPKK